MEVDSPSSHFVTNVVVLNVYVLRSSMVDRVVGEGNGSLIVAFEGDRSRSHVASFGASVNATYSASVEESATVDWRFEHQLTGPPLSMKMYPDVDFLVICLCVFIAHKRGEYG